MLPYTDKEEFNNCPVSKAVEAIYAFSEHSIVGLFIISINLLVFYHECRSLIGYAIRYLFCDR